MSVIIIILRIIRATIPSVEQNKSKRRIRPRRQKGCAIPFFNVNVFFLPQLPKPYFMPMSSLTILTVYTNVFLLPQPRCAPWVRSPTPTLTAGPAGSSRSKTPISARRCEWDRSTPVHLADPTRWRTMTPSWSAVTRTRSDSG